MTNPAPLTPSACPPANLLRALDTLVGTRAEYLTALVTALAAWQRNREAVAARLGRMPLMSSGRTTVSRPVVLPRSMTETLRRARAMAAEADLAMYARTDPYDLALTFSTEPVGLGV